ncbi:unnamed protein product, partial [Allacma fusca]
KFTRTPQGTLDSKEIRIGQKSYESDEGLQQRYELNLLSFSSDSRSASNREKLSH